MLFLNLNRYIEYLKKLTKRSNPMIFSFSYFDTAVFILIMLLLNLKSLILIPEHVSDQKTLTHIGIFHSFQQKYYYQYWMANY